MGLQADDAVHHVHARAFQLAGPRDVGVLVETRLDLDQRQHLLAGMRGVDQRVDDRRIAGCTVQRLLDGQHLRIGRGLRQERLHGRREGIVRVVQQDVALADGGENVLRTGRFDFGDLTIGGRNERTVLEIRTVDASELEQHGRVKRRRQAVDLVGAHAQLVGEQLRQERAGLVGDLQTDRRSETTAQQFLLHGVEQVLGIILFHVDVLVTGDAEGAGLLDDHAREQGFQVGDDQVLHGDEAIAHVGALVFGQIVDRHESVQVARNLHAGEVRLAGCRMLHQHGEVEGTAGNVRERVGRIHGKRRQNREHLLTVVARQALLLGRGELVPAQQHDLFLRQVGEDVVDDVVRVLVLQAVGLLADSAQLLPRAQSGSGRHGDAGVDAALQAGHADHEELVEVVREDRGEARAFDDRQVLILCKLEDTLVELQPAQLTVEETVVRQRFLACLKLALIVLIGLSDMLSYLAAQDRL